MTVVTGDVDAAVDEVVDLLRLKGHRVTTPRRLLIRCLVQSGGHRTAEELGAEVQRLAPDVHLSTIYRNLDELERLGVLEHAHLGHGAATYHLATAPHGHLSCSDCGTIVEVPEKRFASFVREMWTAYRFEVDPRHFAMVGLCADCQETRDRARTGRDRSS